MDDIRTAEQECDDIVAMLHDEFDLSSRGGFRNEMTIIKDIIRIICEKQHVGAREARNKRLNKQG